MTTKRVSDRAANLNVVCAYQKVDLSIVQHVSSVNVKADAAKVFGVLSLLASVHAS